MVVWLDRVFSVCTNPYSVRTHPLDAKVAILNVLVDIGVRWMFGDVTDVEVVRVGVGHTRILAGEAIYFSGGCVLKTGVSGTRSPSTAYNLHSCSTVLITQEPFIEESNDTYWFRVCL